MKDIKELSESSFLAEIHAILKDEFKDKSIEVFSKQLISDFKIKLPTEPINNKDVFKEICKINKSLKFLIKNKIDLNGFSFINISAWETDDMLKTKFHEVVEYMAQLEFNAAKTLSTFKKDSTRKDLLIGFHSASYIVWNYKNHLNQIPVTSKDGKDSKRRTRFDQICDLVEKRYDLEIGYSAKLKALSPFLKK